VGQLPLVLKDVSFQTRNSPTIPKDEEMHGMQCSTKTPGRGDGGTQKGDVWEYPQILGIFGKWGTGGRHIYNIKNIKNKILKINF
jgi:hypothetical protein